MPSLPTLYALLGDPVLHSLSPAIHNAAFRALDIDANYTALKTPADLVGSLMREIAASGGGGNVTLPHKGEAARALDHASDVVTATGACNVFWWDDGLCGDNTDVGAFRAAAEAVVGAGLQGRRVLTVGAGGAARAVVYACLQAEVEALDIINRSRERAESLRRGLGAPANVRVTDPDRLSEAYDVAVNATTLGLRDTDPLPLDLARVNAKAVLDLVYGPGGTPLVTAARAAGLPAEDGRRMLVEGAAASFERWLGVEAPRAVMYEVVGL
ncbi:MAG: shikimate dehydrogenase [Gemmatimonadetes bacterium]|uniref:Shikimate dehydrogenase (NADP(+)) n=1 Tax=Candidatus Kutchimonas denitrificans TaxID=3056748 RepID=A0AAE4Z9U6_9BACT|nr:shikimate dehydrogenase [Gemmatimonadota bacterium]NIR75187.1 shikimate dehydrogenase [Candidatus Kutchimonas denitrificans]NIS00125.1 shikimate dehydrogenase [Gemmatimonadota bacterium]NIT65717.1 shikimate dehydrogenase [Gemmatimonadota bacterium]NIU52995.1 shikimate dehydrogenase [Gemmatimonadota bacterium]